MQLGKSTGFLAWSLLMGSFQLGAAAPADPILTLPLPTTTPILTMPGGATPLLCSSVSRGVTVGPKCHTVTSTATPRGCAPLGNIACPAYIKITTVSVPCNNAECCPTTLTRTVTPACPTGCVIPTETVIVTTGCPVATSVPIPTAILTVPPVTWG